MLFIYPNCSEIVTLALRTLELIPSQCGRFLLSLTTLLSRPMVSRSLARKVVPVRCDLWWLGAELLVSKAGQQH